MKLFTLIFSIYILLLAAVPCCALDNCEQDNITAKCRDEQGKSPVKEKGCNNCSPFFSCHNCCGFIVQEKLGIAAVAVNYPDKFFGLTEQKYYPEYISSFWQPPRVK